MWGFSQLLPALASFIIKLVKIWPGETPHVVVGTLRISLDQLEEFSIECCSVSCCEYCVMPPCENKLVSRNSRKATVAMTVFVE